MGLMVVELVDQMRVPSINRSLLVDVVEFAHVSSRV